MQSHKILYHAIFSYVRKITDLYQQTFEPFWNLNRKFNMSLDKSRGMCVKELLKNSSRVNAC